MKRLCVLAAIALASLSAAAQMPQNFEKGFAADKMYQFSNIDSVNTFNGNLTIVIPIGDKYAIGGGTSYGLVLTYNSTLWERNEVRTIPAAGGDGVPAIWESPSRRSNAGL